MQRNILSGSEFLLYNINDEPVAYSKNCAISINQSLTDVTTKNSDSWSEFMVGLKDWSIEFEGLVSYGEGFTSTYFLDKYQNKEPFFIKFGVVQGAFTHAFYGEVYIENINQTSELDEVAKFSGSLKGVGNLRFTDEGTPEQSGYLKVETDPVFRGSPAFNISDADKTKWSEANSKIVQEIQFITSGSITTLKMKFKDGSIYSAPFENINSIDLSSYYTRSEADTKIATAQVAADTANTLLYNIANDNKLTPNEKINLLKEWLIIQDEKSKLIEQAEIYGVETLNFDVAFITLKEYIGPLLLSMEATTDIWGYELRDKFRAYYDQKVLLLKALSEASKIYTDDEIKNIKIGTRNYHLDGTEIVSIERNQNQILQTGNYPTNSTLAISFMAKAIGNRKLLHIEFEAGTGADFVTTAEWQRYECLLYNNGLKIFSARLVDQTVGAYSFPYNFPSSFNGFGGIEMKDIMVVLGNKSTDFTPAPQDYYNTIDVKNTATLQAAADDAELKVLIAKNAAIASSKAYSEAQRVLAEITAAAYSDGIVTIEEQARINQAANNLQAAKDDATNKANAAAAYGITAQILHTNLINSLKSLAYEDVVEVSKLGSTIVTGGYIKTSLLDANYIKSDIINSTYLNTLNLTATNIATNTSGYKRVVVDGVENNIRLFDSNNSVLALLDDDSAIEGSYSNTSMPSFPYPKNYLGSYDEGGITKYNYATMGAGLSIGLNPTDFSGFTSLGRKGLASYGGAIQVKPTANSSGASTTIDFAGLTTTGTISTYGNLRVEGSITVGTTFNAQTGIDFEGDVRMGGGDFYRMKWVNGILVSSVRQS
jgi:predicted secreted protein